MVIGAASYKDLGRSELIAYKKFMRGEAYMVAEFHRQAAEELRKVLFGENLRLMIFWPPRHGKTELVAGTLAPMFVGRNPHKELILSSSDASLSRKMSKKVRSALESEKYQWLYPGVLPLKGSSGVEEWDIELNGEATGGSVRAASIGQGIQGRGAHLAIGDDWVKSAKEVRSQLWRENFKEWYQSDFRDRIYPGGAIVISHTRWHLDDPAGWLLSDECSNTMPWRVIEFPAYDESTGTWLWPERYTVADYEDIKNSMSPYAWSAKYMQKPIPIGEQVIDPNWFGRIPISDLPKMEKRVIGVDLASSEKTSADYRVACCAGVHEGRIYIGPIIRNRKQWPDFRQDVITLARVFKAHRVGVESTGFQLGGMQDVRRELAPYGIPVVEADVPGDKIAKAETWTPLAAAGLITLVDDGSGWIEAAFKEFEDFPLGDHDDIPDSIAQAIYTLRFKVSAEHLRRSEKEYEIGGHLE